MAILDRHLTPFLEMLSELDLDWLVFEIIDGIRRGQELEETEDALALARGDITSGDAKRIVYDSEDNDEGKPILGDDQLEWAAQYVKERLEATLAEMGASLDNLDDIIAAGRDQSTEDAGFSTTLVLGEGEEGLKVDRARVKKAQAELPKLQQALTEWLTSTR